MVSKTWETNYNVINTNYYLSAKGEVKNIGTSFYFPTPGNFPRK